MSQPSQTEEVTEIQPSRSKALKEAQQRYRLKNRLSLNVKSAGYNKKHNHYKNIDAKTFLLFRKMFK